MPKAIVRVEPSRRTEVATMGLDPSSGVASEALQVPLAPFAMVTTSRLSVFPNLSVPFPSSSRSVYLRPPRDSADSFQPSACPFFNPCAAKDAAMVMIAVGVLENADLSHPQTFKVIPEQELLRRYDELPDVRYPIAVAGIAAIGHYTGGPAVDGDGTLFGFGEILSRVQVFKKFIRQSACRVGICHELRRSSQTCGFSMRCRPTMIARLAEFAGKAKARLSQAIPLAAEVSPPVHMGLHEGFE